MRFHHFVRWTVEDPPFRSGEHGNVVERVPNRDAPKVHSLKGLDGLAFLVFESESVAGDGAVVRQRQGIAEDAGIPEFFKQRHGVLLKRVGEKNNPRDDGPEPGEEIDGTCLEGIVGNIVHQDEDSRPQAV